MHPSTFALLASTLLCVPAYAAQAGAVVDQERQPEAPSYPAPPQLPESTVAHPAAPGAVAIPSSTLLCRPAEGTADGRLMLCEPQLAAPSRGWGENAGFAGLSLGAVALGLGLLMETSDSLMAELGVVYMMGTTGALVPVVAAGSRSSRRGAGVEGIPELRVFGWMAYAASFAVPTLMVLTMQFPEHPFAVIGALDAAALLLHGLDALAAGRAARRKVDQPASPEVAPYLAPVPSADGRAAVSLGLAGRY